MNFDETDHSSNLSISPNNGRTKITQDPKGKTSMSTQQPRTNVVTAPASNTPAKPMLTFQYTDLGNAKRWASLHRDRYKWIYELREWYRWNGARWEPDIGGHQVCAVDDVLDSLDNEYALLVAQRKDHPDNAEKIAKRMETNRKWYAASQAITHISAMNALARSQPGISKSFTEFDSKGHFIGVKNGIVNLRTGEFVEDQPQYYISKCCGAAYDPHAESPEWDKFLMRIFEGDQDKIAFVQRLFGQALMGTEDKSILTIFCGHGANGKSTLVDTMVSLLGDYAKNTSAATITETKSNKEYYLAELKGVRLSIINESKQGALLDEELVKSLVDSGKIQARQIYRAPITFQPVTTPILTTNYPPRITGDYSIARRILFVTFPFQLPVAERNPKFRTDVLEKELPGILNWALAGCRAYQKQGLNPPHCIIESTRTYVKDNDRFGRFLEDCCVDSPKDRISLQDIKTAYSDWLEQKGYREIGEDRVSNDLRARGYPVEKRNGGRFYALGLKLQSSDDEEKSTDDKFFTGSRPMPGGISPAAFNRVDFVPNPVDE